MQCKKSVKWWKLHLDNCFSCSIHHQGILHRAKPAHTSVQHESWLIGQAAQYFYFIQKSWDWWKWNHSQMVSFWRGLMLLSIDHHTSIPRSQLLGRSGQRLPSLAGNLTGAQMMMVYSMQGKEPLFWSWHFWLFNSNHWMFHITPFHNVLWQ